MVLPFVSVDPDIGSVALLVLDLSLLVFVNGYPIASLGTYHSSSPARIPLFELCFLGGFAKVELPLHRKCKWR